MSLFRSPPSKWDTARHEAAHVVVARALGATDLEAEVYGGPNADGEYGHFTGMFDGSREDEAVILAAGALASPGCPGDADNAQIRELLRGSGTSLSDVQSRASDLVAGHRGAIKREAGRLLAGRE